MKNLNISSIDLLLLGLIRNEPLSAYDLSKMVGIYEMVKISVPAIYKNIKRLYNEGYLEYSIKKTTNMPEKKIYTITNKGKDRFLELLELCAQNAINYYNDFNVSLLFLGSIDSNTGNKIIDIVNENLSGKQQSLKNQIDMFKNLPFPIPNIGEQHYNLNKTIIEWLKKLKKEYNK